MSNSSVLSTITDPKDLRNLSDEEIDTLAEEIRARIISATSTNGGHVGPAPRLRVPQRQFCLGCCPPMLRPQTVNWPQRREI